MRIRKSSIVIFVVLLLIALLLINNIRLSKRLSSRLSINADNQTSDPCFHSIRSLPPVLKANGEVIDVFLIDTNAVEKLKSNCRASLDPPLSVMLSESDEGIAIDTNIYNPTFYVDKGDYLLLRSTPERVLLKQDYHRIGSLLVPVDLEKFLSFYQRSKLVHCLNKSMHRQDTKRYLPERFENKLAELRDALIDMGAMPFLSGGTLLGWYRECDIIPHTTDADFGVLREEYRSRMSDELKSLPGFRVQTRMGREFDSLEFSLLASGGGKVDVFVVYDENDERTYTSGLDFKTHRRYKWINPKAKGYCSGILRDRLFFVPCNTEEMLESLYGLKWKIDHSSSTYDWKNSSSNVVENGFFTGEEMRKYFTFVCCDVSNSMWSAWNYF